MDRRLIVHLYSSPHRPARIKLVGGCRWLAHESSCSDETFDAPPLGCDATTDWALYLIKKPFFITLAARN